MPNISPQGYKINIHPTNVNPFWITDSEGNPFLVEVNVETVEDVEAGTVTYTWYYMDANGDRTDIVTQTINTTGAVADIKNELINVRTGADDTVYLSAGDAVRAQFNINNALINGVKDEVEDIRRGFNGAIYNSAGDAVRIQLTVLNAIANNNRDELLDARNGINHMLYASVGDAIREQITDVNESIDGVKDEVEDIRTGADGTVYDSAGAAVRGQVSEITETLDSVKDEVEGIRTGADGTVYGSAGEAVRTQFTAVNTIANENRNELVDARTGVDGTVYDSTGEAIRVQIENTNPNIPVKGNNTGDTIKNIYNMLGVSPKTASGGIVTISDAAAVPPKSLKALINAVQDLHGYSKPWAGGANVNLCVDKLVNDQESITGYGVTMTIENGKFKFNGEVTTSGGRLTFMTQRFTLPAGTYTMSSDAGLSGVAPYLHDSDGNRIINVSGTTTLESDTEVFVGFNVSAPATFTNLLVALQIEEGSTATEWTPYSNICPIIGWDTVNVTRCGKNLWGGEKLADDIVAKVPQATKDTTNKTVTYFAGQVSGITLFNKFKENTRYTFYFSTSSAFTNMAVRYTDGTSDGIEANTYKVTSANKTVSEIRGSWASGTTILNYEECGIFEGAITAEDFEAYNGQTYNIDLSDTQGTVYYGTLNLTTGEGQLTHKKKVLNGTQTILQANWIPTSNGVGWTYPYSVLGDSKIVTSGTPNMLCDTLEVKNYNAVYSGGIGISLYYSTYASICLRQKDTSLTTISSINAYLAENPIEVVYELATPITFNITPENVTLLQGTNNIWADTGDTEVEYYPTIQSLIDALS